MADSPDPISSPSLSGSPEIIEDDFVEETYTERLLALCEIIPAPLINAVKNTTVYGFDTVKKVGWFVASTLVVLALPISVEMERQEFEEMSKSNDRKILLGQ